MAVLLGDTLHVHIEICELGAMIADRQHRYRAFLLRLWQERSGGEWIWRASLEDPHSNIRTGFRDVEQLSAFLSDLTKDSAVEES